LTAALLEVYFNDAVLHQLTEYLRCFGRPKVFVARKRLTKIDRSKGLTLFERTPTSAKVQATVIAGKRDKDSSMG
jgi:hypothetical protein